ncbi:Gfo/Idh/MocA family oxidoreductase [Mesorhizobium sp. BR1-1-16]|uniref:Gfo/Idh/MocA family protein n=1 Tax=Mesorhizobium sp. BR1-1-16 TaxID=2876653 RepID=UPI001CCEE8A3|nr:Gfo/Idh/MocA family oxidoreductase [Mesorhizobium sp. BR1-1-16]MBZ9935330.1 Gfo/Idh/MocA family oxidoreductase [Mesorhizobium sp. BR1-1-16]
MDQNEIRTGVVGLGYFGSFHARQHAANPRARLVAVVDADHGRATAVAAEHGAQPLFDHRDLIGKVDAVSITVPTSLHHAVAGDLLDAGIHVLIEKPIAESPEAARDLIRRAAAAGVVLQVGHIERFSPVFGELARATQAPRVIELTRIGPWKGRAVDVDVVLDLMIHDIDLALALISSPVSSVEAIGAAVRAPTNDFAHALLRFENGAAAHLHASRVADRQERTIRVVDMDRVVLADLAARTVSWTAHGADDRHEIAVPPSDNLALEIGSFLDAVARRQPPVVDGEAGLRALDVAERIMRAIKRPSEAAQYSMNGVSS